MCRHVQVVFDTQIQVTTSCILALITCDKLIAYMFQMSIFSSEQERIAKVERFNHSKYIYRHNK